jgi:DNA-binding PadR family transcriptional regulator
MTGYDLKKYFDQSVAHFWSATQSHIYKTLDSLEKDGMAASQIIPQEGKPNRKQYRITDAGRNELHAWTSTPLPVEVRREAWLIQIFFSLFSSNEEIIALLEARMAQMREQLHTLRTSAQAAVAENARQLGVERARRLWQVTLDHGIDYYEFELAWHEKTIEAIRSLPPLELPNRTPG